VCPVCKNFRGKSKSSIPKSTIMATAVTDNIVLSLPKEQLFAVTYPGLVKNVNKAISQFPADIDVDQDIVSNARCVHTCH
jgi:hypothetical protein